MKHLPFFIAALNLFSLSTFAANIQCPVSSNSTPISISSCAGEFQQDLQESKSYYDSVDASLPALDQTQVALNNNQKVLMLNMKPPRSNYLTFTDGKYLYGSLIVSNGDGTTYLAQTNYAIEALNWPSQWDYLMPDGEIITPSSARKVVIVDSYHQLATTRDNKLYSLNQNGHVVLLASNINPFTLSSVSPPDESNVYSYIADRANKMYEIDSTGLKYLFTVPSQLQNPMSISLFDKLGRVCSINNSRDYYCTGSSSVTRVYNVYSGLTSFTDNFNSRQAWLVGRNICGNGPNAFFATTQYSDGVTYMDVGCFGGIYLDYTNLLQSAGQSSIYNDAYTTSQTIYNSKSSYTLNSQGIAAPSSSAASSVPASTSSSSSSSLSSSSASSSSSTSTSSTSSASSGSSSSAAAGQLRGSRSNR